MATSPSSPAYLQRVYKQTKVNMFLSPPMLTLTSQGLMSEMLGSTLAAPSTAGSADNVARERIAMATEAESSSRNTALRRFETHQVDGIAEIPANILEKGVSMWSDYVVGFFVEKRLPFPMVKASLAQQWKVKGSYSISTD
ncbi:hypothetical protein IFM89_025085 [Coptis chinensis]|uniref:Uncharacterized protein n=1 Tax=Coptis chinensis TaxID=261450 RepID=A0A835HXB1_9MAGN|nr:hypothetical protein IFM89_025085 [Coptis chinensis]